MALSSDTRMETVRGVFWKRINRGQEQQWDQIDRKLFFHNSINIGVDDGGRQRVLFHFKASSSRQDDGWKKEKEGKKRR